MAVLATSMRGASPGRSALALAGTGPSLVPLATLPGYVFHLNRLLSKEHADADSVYAAVAADPALALHVLCLANAYLPTGFPPILDLRAGIATVGMYELRALVMNIPVLEYTNAPANLLEIQLFWQRSLFIAQMSSHLAECTGLASPHEAYSAGLIYRIGELVPLMAQQEKWDQSLAREICDGGMDVTTISGRITLASRLPWELVQTCGLPPDSRPGEPLPRVVIAAYRLCDHHRLNAEGVVTGLRLDIPAETAAVLKELGLDQKGAQVQPTLDCAARVLAGLEFTSMGLLTAAEASRRSLAECPFL